MRYIKHRLLLYSHCQYVICWLQLVTNFGNTCLRSYDPTLTGSPPFACRLRYIIPSPDTGSFGGYPGNLAKLLQRKKIKLKMIMGVYEEEMILIPRILVLFYTLMPTFSDLSSRLTVSYSIISQQNSFHSKLQGEYTSFYTSNPSTFFSATSETSLDIAISS